MPRGKGLLRRSQDPDAPEFGEVLADDPELVQAWLGEGGEIPRSLPPFDQVVVLAEWVNVARDPAIVDRWRRSLAAAAVAVLVTVPRDRVGEAAGVLAPLPVDDCLGSPWPPAHRVR